MIRPFSVEKMQRHIARQTPDQQTKIFNVHDGGLRLEHDVQSWRDQFMKNMRLKHGKKIVTYTIYREEMIEFGKVRFHIEVVLREKHAH